jgi:NAD(P)-dependent dehydrogenase (short-subunit alcohol dehydrogenase family)
VASGFDGKVALVTGAASGIGAATAELLRTHGATVVAADVVVCQGVESLDVTDEVAVDRLVHDIVGTHGRLDLAANVAGVSGAYATVAETTVADFRRVLGVNLEGTFNCLRAELRAMLAGGRGGAIVNVSSGAGLMGVPGLGAYAASKHAVVGLTRSAALEVAAAGIRVNAVCPGAIRTPMLRGFVGGDDAALERMGRAMPMGRLGEPEEVAEVIAWLLSDGARFVTGDVVRPDGGAAAT